ncbi:putative UMP-CMP kinase 2 [Citrus sinensis]|nr:putative UMP-CMP kinase 2 [Citrus sinensis]
MWRRLALHLSPLISSSRSSTLNQTACSLKNWKSLYLKEPQLLNLIVIIFSDTLMQAKGGLFPKGKVLFLSFVLVSGPGSGKGTRCTKIVKNFGLTHLSAGDLLRREIASNSEYGKIVPSEVTISLIRKEIESSDNHKFLTNAEPDIVLSFAGPEEEMVNRVLNHNKGPVDYNIDTVRKRLKVFKALNLPVINYYSRQGKLHMCYSVVITEGFVCRSMRWGTVNEIFEQVRAAFAVVEIIFLVCFVLVTKRII